MLRSKLSSADSRVQIETVWGYGYRLRSVEADEYEDAYSYILYVDVGAVMQYSAYLNADFFGNNI